MLKMLGVLLVAVAIWLTIAIYRKCLKSKQQAKSKETSILKELGIMLQKINGEKSLYGVLLQLCEWHWDNVVRADDEECYKFSYKRRLCKKAVVDAEVSSLLQSYMARNRFKFRENVVQWCAFMSKNRDVYEILAASNGGKLPESIWNKNMRELAKAFSVNVCTKFDINQRWLDEHMPWYMVERKTQYLQHRVHAEAGNQ